MNKKYSILLLIIMFACMVNLGCKVEEGEKVDYICEHCEKLPVFCDEIGECRNCEGYTMGTTYAYCSSCAEKLNACMMCGNTFKNPH